jgi:hypothetical protein
LIPRPMSRRTRLYHLSRDHAFLMKCSVAIACAGLLTAWAIVQSQPADLSDIMRRLPQLVSDLPPEVQQSLKSLQLATSQPHDPPSEPRALARWLYDSADLMEDVPDQETLGRFLQLCEKGITDSKTDASTKTLLRSYLAARYAAEDGPSDAALATLQTAAKTSPHPPLANELLGMALLTRDDPKQAVAALQEEGQLPDGIFARETVISLAIDYEDKGLLRQLLANPLYFETLRWEDRSRAGMLLDDLWLQWTGILADQWFNASLHGVGLSLLSASLWYVVLVRFGSGTSRRWLWPLIPVVAGVASIWPTLLLQNFQESSLKLMPATEFPRDLIYEILGVGLREEFSKLLLFSLFLPWLLKKREPGLALLTGAFIGLGFSLEENVNYISMGHDVWGRVLTASFLHLALTGLAGHALYGMLRTRFHEASGFVATFAMAGLLHGLYNWAPQGSVTIPFAQDLDLLSLLLLSGIAHQFYSLMSGAKQPNDGVISTLSIFVIGSALLVASGLITVALQAGLWPLVTAFGNSALGLVPIAIFHARKLG